MKGLPSQPNQICTNPMDLKQWEDMFRPLQPFRWLVKMETIMNLCARRKVEHKGHARSAQRAHGKTPW
jgi:hypothetical protein